MKKSIMSISHTIKTEILTVYVQPLPFYLRGKKCFLLCIIYFFSFDSPSSPSEAAHMGVIGGWSPASVPFLGLFNPFESRAFT